MFLNILIDLLILKTYYGQFTLTTKEHCISSKCLPLQRGGGVVSQCHQQSWGETSTACRREPRASRDAYLLIEWNLGFMSKLHSVQRLQSIYWYGLVCINTTLCSIWNGHAVDKRLHCYQLLTTHSENSSYGTHHLLCVTDDDQFCCGCWIYLPDDCCCFFLFLCLRQPTMSAFSGCPSITFICLIICSFMQTYTVAMVSHECLEQFW